VVARRFNAWNAGLPCSSAPGGRTGASCALRARRDTGTRLQGLKPLATIGRPPGEDAEGGSPRLVRESISHFALSSPGRARVGCQAFQRLECGPSLLLRARRAHGRSMRPPGAERIGAASPGAKSPWLRSIALRAKSPRADALGSCERPSRTSSCLRPAGRAVVARRFNAWNAGLPVPPRPEGARARRAPSGRGENRGGVSSG